MNREETSSYLLWAKVISSCSPYSLRYAPLTILVLALCSPNTAFMASVISPTEHLYRAGQAKGSSAYFQFLKTNAKSYCQPFYLQRHHFWHYRASRRLLLDRQGKGWRQWQINLWPGTCCLHSQGQKVTLPGSGTLLYGCQALFHCFGITTLSHLQQNNHLLLTAIVQNETTLWCIFHDCCNAPELDFTPMNHLLLNKVLQNMFMVNLIYNLAHLVLRNLDRA